MAKKVVLGVDDEPALNRLVKDSLETGDYEVISVLSAEEGLKILSKARVDLVLIDIMLPGMSGVDLCKKIRADKRFKNLPLAFLSVLQPSQLVQKNIKALNMADYIQKPFEYKDLVVRVKKIIG